MYRNPLTDDPERQGPEPRAPPTPSCSCTTRSCWCSRRTARRSTWTRWTLETLDDYYTFGGKLDEPDHTAHPKIDPLTGEYFGFGYEATGLLSKDIFVFSADQGRPA